MRVGIGQRHLIATKKILTKIKITKQHELKTKVPMQQKSNDFAIVSLLHRNNCIARRIAVAPGV